MKQAPWTSLAEMAGGHSTQRELPVTTNAPGRPRDPAVDVAVLGAARELLEERGFHDTSLQAIARRAGVGVASIRRRWDTREDLIEQSLVAVPLPFREPPEATLAPALTWWCRLMVEWSAQPAVRTALPGLLATYIRDPTRHARLVESWERPIREDIVALVGAAGGGRRAVTKDAGETLFELLRSAAVMRGLTRGLDEATVYCTRTGTVLAAVAERGARGADAGTARANRGGTFDSQPSRTPDGDDPSEASDAPRDELSRPGRPRLPGIDAAVLRSTRELLAEVGYADTTIRAAALRAGVSAPSVYRRWPTKEDLVEAVILSPDRPLRLVHSGDLRTDLRRWAGTALAWAADPPVRAALPGLLSAYLTAPERYERLDARGAGPARQWLDDALVHAVSVGQADAGCDRGMIYDLLRSAVTFRALTEGDVDGARYCGHIVDALGVVAKIPAHADGG